MESLKLHYDVERFLIHEAALLDGWHLKEWESLFTDDGEYLIPPLNIENPETADHRTLLFVVDDDRETIAARTDRLLRKDAYAESPRSKLRHLVTNVQIIEDAEPLRVSANLIVYRSRRGQTTLYVGRCFYLLMREEQGFRIREKRVCLDNDLFQPQGSLAIIL